MVGLAVLLTKLYMMKINYNGNEIEVKNPATQKAVMKAVFGAVSEEGVAPIRKRKFSKHTFSKWSEADRELLTREVNNGTAPKLIAKLLQKTPGSVYTQVYSMRKAGTLPPTTKTEI